MIAILLAIFRRDLKLAVRRKTDLVASLFFFIVTVNLLPFGVGSSASLMHAIGPGVIWIAALLSAMISTTSLFYYDYQDGTLEQFLLSSAPLGSIMAVKIFVHWLVSGLPLLIVTPLLGLQFQLGWDEVLVLLGSLLIGTPLLSLFGAIGAALTLGSKNAGALVAILILPIYIPILIFGAGAVSASASGTDPDIALLLLGAMLSLGLVFGPYTTAISLRAALD
jgi:heme exporter protein B